MTTPTLEIQEPGLQTTVQDGGRYGYQRYGVPVSGAMDLFALRAANILIGNDDGDAGLEMTALGPKIRFAVDTCIAVTGANLSPTLDGSPLPMWETVEVAEGSVLAFGRAQDGLRAYLTVPGGIDVPQVMGSRSTYLKGGFGGFQGRALHAGDVLSTLAPGRERGFAKRRLARGASRPTYGNSHDLRVVLGPQQSAFTAEAISTFLGSTYTVSMDSDRMGSRLEGPTVEHAAGADIVSDGTPLGAVQVPGAGTPIILLADRGVTGGYAKIATVISTDIGKLGQAMPGDTVTFSSVSIEEAQSVYRTQEYAIRAIAETETAIEGQERINVTIDGQMTEVVDSDGEPLSLAEPLGGPLPGGPQRVRATVDGRTYEFDVETQRGASG